MEPEDNTSTEDRQRLLQERWEIFLLEWFPIREGYDISVMRDSETYGMQIDIVTVTHEISHLTFHIVAGEFDSQHRDPQLHFLEDRVRLIIPPITSRSGFRTYYPWGATLVDNTMTFYRRYGNDNYLSDESFEGERSSDISDLETPMEMIMGDFESTMNSAFPTLADLITDSSPSPHVNGASNSDENGTGSWPSVDTIPLAEFNNRSEATRTNGEFYYHYNSSESSEEK